VGGTTATGSGIGGIEPPWTTKSQLS
jgi:hypothetical protein